MVNNAGVSYRAVVEHVAEEERLAQMNVNFRGRHDGDAHDGFQKVRYTAESDRSEHGLAEPYHEHYVNMTPFIERPMRMYHWLLYRMLPNVRTWGPSEGRISLLPKRADDSEG